MRKPEERADARSKLTGARKSELVWACMELGRLLHARETDPSRPKVNHPRDAHARLKTLGAARAERLELLVLDAQNAIVGHELISMGALNTTRTHPREIFRPAIERGGMGVIIAHNHPSGSLDPSPEDVEFTRAVKRAGELVGVELYDHLIVTRDGFASFRERGLL